MNPRDLAIQQAIQGNADPTLIAALIDFQKTGIPPTDPRAVAVINQAFQANGVPTLPDPNGPFATQAGDPNNRAANKQAQATVNAAQGIGSGMATAANNSGTALPAAPNPTAGVGSPGGAATATSVLPAPPATGGGGTTTTNPLVPASTPGGNNMMDMALAGDDLGQMQEALRMIGLNPHHLGGLGKRIATQILPHLQSYMKTQGFGPEGGTPGDNLKGRVQQFANMINGGGGFNASLQSYAQGIKPALLDKMGQTDDEGIQNQYLAMLNNLTNAGQNTLTAQVAKEQQDRAMGMFSEAGRNAVTAGTPVPTNYVKWLQGQTGSNDLGNIVRLVTGGR